MCQLCIKILLILKNWESLLQHNFWQPAVMKLEIWFSIAATVEIWVSLTNLCQPLCSHSLVTDLRAAAYTSAQSPQCLYHLSDTKTCAPQQQLWAFTTLLGLFFQNSGSDGFLFTSQLWHHQLLYIPTGNNWCVVSVHLLKCFLVIR